MPNESTKLTEAQWDALLSAWLKMKKEDPTAVRGTFCSAWCEERGLKTPHSSSIMRRLIHNKKRIEYNRPLRYFSGCGCALDVGLLNEIADKQPKYASYVEDQAVVCPTCKSKAILKDRDAAADVYIKHHMESKKGPIIDWPCCEEVEKLVLEKACQGFDTERDIPPVLACCPDFRYFMMKPIQVRKLELKDKSNPTPMFRSRIANGKHPRHFDYHPDQVACNPDDGTIGLLLLRNGDFAMVDSSGLINEAHFALSCAEDNHIRAKQTGKRQGPAFGSFMPSKNLDHDIVSLSPATKYSKVILADHEDAAKASVNVASMYCNLDPKGSNEPKMIDYGSFYSDGFMTRLNKYEKFKNCSQDNENDPLCYATALRLKYLAEMKSRLRAYCVMDHYGLKNKKKDHWPSFFEAVNRVCGREYFKWKAIHPKISTFEAVLLEWCTSTGEMRNHQALKVHLDANKSHPLETMMVFGRVEPSHSHYNVTKQISLFKDAYLCALWEMIALKTRCGKDIWHVSLENTYHLPDLTRDKYNFSWVHGP